MFTFPVIKILLDHNTVLCSYSLWCECFLEGRGRLIGLSNHIKVKRPPPPPGYISSKEIAWERWFWCSCLEVLKVIPETQFQWVNIHGRVSILWQNCLGATHVLIKGPSRPLVHSYTWIESFLWSVVGALFGAKRHLLTFPRESHTAHKIVIVFLACYPNSRREQKGQ